MEDNVRVVEARKVDLVFQTADGPVHALSEIDLEINKGDFISLIGPSGCGKTTVLRLIAGLERPSSGVIKIDGVKVSEKGVILIPPHQRQVGFVFQDLALLP